MNSYTQNILLGALVLVFLGLPVNADQKASNPTEPRNQNKTRNLVEDPEESARLPIKKNRYMFSVTLHKQSEIQSLLSRADKLSKTMRTKGNNSRIALILHGPEIRFFSNKRYKENKEIVDRAARLDGDQVIEIKVCKTKMDELGISDKEMPSFVEIIPYAPEEEEKLLKKGYVYL